MVAGAAALLREAAPEAPMRVITAALERGAQPVQSLLNKVTYGQLDVACALDWLARQQSREQNNWDLVGGLNAEPFVAATASCARKRSYRVEETIEIKKSQLYSDANRSATIGALLDGEQLADSAAGRSLTWQRTILFNLGITRPIAGRAIFRVGTTAEALAPKGGPAVYDVGKLLLGCTGQNFELTGLTVRFLNAVRPIGWYYPTDALPPYAGIGIQVVAEKPWFAPFIASPLEVQARGTCSYMG